MTDFGAAISTAFTLVANLDSDLSEVVLLSLKVSLSAVVIASIIGLPIGAALALGIGAWRVADGEIGIGVLLIVLMQETTARK